MRIYNDGGRNTYRDVRVELNTNTCYLEQELLNYELEDVIKAINHVFNIELIKKEPRNE